MLAKMYSPLIHSCTPSLQLPGAYFGLVFVFLNRLLQFIRDRLNLKGIKVHRTILDLFENSMVMAFSFMVLFEIRFSQRYIAESLHGCRCMQFKDFGVFSIKFALKGIRKPFASNALAIVSKAAGKVFNRHMQYTFIFLDYFDFACGIMHN
jgi:hypothetical protein